MRPSKSVMDMEIKSLKKLFLPWITAFMPKISEEAKLISPAESLLFR